MKTKAKVDGECPAAKDGSCLCATCRFNQADRGYCIGCQSCKDRVKLIKMPVCYDYQKKEKGE